MQTLSWKCLAFIAIALCSFAMAVPVPQESPDAPSPVADAVSIFFFAIFSIDFCFSRVNFYSVVYLAKRVFNVVKICLMRVI